MAELCLGTVQFGMKYGINNRLGQPGEEDCFHMLDKAIENGISVIDTARAYGTAELVLGNYFKQRHNQDKVKLISKLRPNIIEENETDVYSVVRREAEESLKRLNVSSLEGYLLHTPQYVRNPEIVRALERLKEEGVVRHIGVSIYDIEDGDAAIGTGVMDYIQLPYSILDQRGVKEGFIRRAKNCNITIFARSAFLQGLFFMEEDRIPPHLQDVIPHLRMFDQMLETYGVDKLSALMQFVTCEEAVDYLVFGVDTVGQLEADLACCREKRLPDEFRDEIKRKFQPLDKSIIFPSLWSGGKKAE